MIDIYIALTEFSKQKFIQAGFPQKKILIKPNFVDRKPCYLDSYLTKKRNGALFVGRISQEKGVTTLLKAWGMIGDSLPLKIVGDGPLKHVVQSAALCTHNICWLGQQTIKEVYTLMAKAEILVFPSEWYETFGRVAIEAFAHGTPVIASRIGAIAEIVAHHRTGLLFEPGNARDLSEKVQWAKEHPAEMSRMGRNARAEYEAKYTPEKNYHMLMAIYEQAIENHRRRQRNIARH
jgi:glycosyltransferase involved in cell wall biosynthesis